MSRLTKIILYPLLFVMSFLLFLYWMFPYDVVKDRVTGILESQFGGGVEVDMAAFAPYWFTGIDISKLSVRRPGGEELLSCKRLRARASIVSLLVGSPSVSFDAQIGKGEISGSVAKSEDMMAIDVEMSDIDLASLKLISASTGLAVSSQIDGEISLRVDQQRPIRSTGRVELQLRELKTAASELKVAGTGFELPEVVFSKGREGSIKLEVSKGTIGVESVKFAGGDLGIDLKGKIFLSSKVENYRFNLSGAFTVSPKLAEALPFLFIVEQQKQQDGSYPLTIAGRLAKPSIKVGTFTLPL